MKRRFWKTALFAVLIAVVICIAGGCGSSATSDKTAGNSIRTLTDSKGNTVKVSEKPQRIVSMMLDADEILMDLVSPSRIAALTYLSDDPGISHISERSKQIKNRIKGQNAEQILALKPDLVLIPDFWSPTVLQTLRDMKIPVYVYKTPYTIEAVKSTMKEIAGVVGETQRGNELNRELEKRLAKLQDKLVKIQSLPPRKVIAITGAGAYGTKGSLYDDMCSFLHINNCQRDLKLDKSTMIPKELIVQANPDIIIVPSWNSPGMHKVQEIKELLEDPSLKSVNAVKTKNIKAIPGQSLYCINHYIADSMELLAKTVYPEHFK